MWHIGFPETLWFTRNTAYQLVGGISAYLTEMMMAISFLPGVETPELASQTQAQSGFPNLVFLY